MAGSTSLAALLLLVASGSALATPTTIGEIDTCIHAAMSAITASFAGNATCPKECAECHDLPPFSRCPEVCHNAEVFCGCSGIMFRALDAAKGCCTGLAGILLLACSAATEELGMLAKGLFKDHCVTGAGCHTAVPGETCFKEVQWAKTEGINQHPEWYPGLTASSSDAEFQQVVHKSEPTKCPVPCGAGKSAMVGFPALSDLAGKASASLLQQGASAQAYVGAHSMGAKCVSMVEGVERAHAEEAEKRGTSGEVPDLHAAAALLATRASHLLGANMLAVKAQLHGAMTAAWSEEDGPGMDADDICEVILKHHDSL